MQLAVDAPLTSRNPKNPALFTSMCQWETVARNIFGLSFGLRVVRGDGALMTPCNFLMWASIARSKSIDDEIQLPVPTLGGIRV